ncbi:MAG: hypothetical protein AB8H86_31670 [Polyangiales bacterium]
MTNSFRFLTAFALLSQLGCNSPPVAGPGGTLGYCCPITANEGCGARGIPGGWAPNLDECVFYDFDHERAALSTDAYGCDVMIPAGLCSDAPPPPFDPPLEPVECITGDQCPGLTQEEAENIGESTWAACIGPRPAGENIDRRCASGVEPPSCQTEGFCGESFCIEDACGVANCVEDCSADDSCAAEGLTCEDGVCTFSCLTDGFAGCPEDHECRSNGQCGVPVCNDDSDCEANEVCSEPTHLLLSDHDGCDPRPCTTDECGEGLFCVDGYCSTELGMCGEAMTWFPPA